jgi:hypothetical protein
MAVAQETTDVDHWELERESIELIPLTVETYSASTGLWTATTGYTVACVPKGSRPSSFSAPTTDDGQTGYMVNGPTLGAGNPGNFEGYYKIDGSQQHKEKLAFTLRLK